ncbi:hypothetical protein [Lyngbya aestuarii]|uniref:hypothetical protein n=1 Tax=Lyngbya aestuarii TaxID=118322 RepID=UPI00403D6A4D
MRVLLTLYLSTALNFFITWFAAFQHEPGLSVKQIRFSWLVLLLATIFWPIVVPISYWMGSLDNSKNWLPNHFTSSK